MRTTERLRRFAGTVAAALLAATLLLVAASTAQAEIELSEHMVTDNEHVTVHGTVPEEAEEEEEVTHVAIAVCDIDDATTPIQLGTRCDASNAIAPTPVEEFTDPVSEEDELELFVQDVFSNWNFTINQPGIGTTECAGTEGPEDCAVVVSYYDWAAGPPTPPDFLWAEAEEITFEEGP